MDLVILIGAILVYFGFFVKSCPNIIKKYRQLLLGIVIGLLIYKYMNIEGSTWSDGLVPFLVAALFVIMLGLTVSFIINPIKTQASPSQSADQADLE